MLRKLLLQMVLLTSVLVSSFSAYSAPNMSLDGLACGQALPTTDTQFCTSFRKIAECHCMAAGYPQPKCGMEAIYKLMLGVYHTQQRACEAQKNTSVQTCMDDWNCYRLGGQNSQGQLCSSTGQAC